MPQPPDTIALLDDEPRRLGRMTARLKRAYSEFTVRTFPDAPAMLDWLPGHLQACVLISLDHDLESTDPDLNPGSGREVADWLASQAAVCPVIVHSTNVPAAAGMLRVLEEAGWTTRRVLPYDDLLWINELWRDTVRELLG